MANVTIAGATYENVPAIQVPSGSGTASFYETKDVTYNLTGGASASVTPSEVVAGQGFSLKLKAPAGYNLNGVTITMGGVDITSQVFTPDESGGGGDEPNLQTKSVSYTPTTSAQSAQVTADSGYDGLEQVNVSVGAIPSEYIVPTGTKSITENGTGIDVTQYASVDVAVSGASPVKTATGTFTGNGTRTVDISCDFEPDLIYWSSDPGTTASSGVVAGIIAREMMAASRYRNNSTTNSHYAVIDITAMNTGGSSYSFRATYADNTITLYGFSNNARALFTSGRTYSYKLVKWTT